MYVNYYRLCMVTLSIKQLVPATQQQLYVQHFVYHRKNNLEKKKKKNGESETKCEMHG